MKKAIIHIDLDTFFVSCERLIDSRLQNKPVLIGGTSDRGVVASCSYEARKFGVHSAMPMKLARQLCPEAIVIRGNSGIYSKYSNLVTDIIKEDTPLYEKSSIDEFYIDATGMDRFFGTYQWASELRQKIIRETGLPISFGLSQNKTVSKIGTGQAKPNNQIFVEEGTERPFLAPLSVKKIPMVGEKTYIQLHQLGVRKIRTIQKMDVELLESAFGKNGIMIWKKANGIDSTPVHPYQERKSISIERTFEKDTTDVHKLKSIVMAMAENLAYQLRNGEKLTGCVALKIRYSDFNTYTRQVKIPYTSSDHTIISTIKELFDKLFDRRLLVRLVGVRLSHLVNGNHQIHLFEDSEKIIRLYSAMDKLRNRYGQDSVKRLSSIDSRGIGRMNPFNGQPPIIPAHRRG